MPWYRKILPKILAVITRESRYLPQIKWSSECWTHNLFRLYEIVFWRRLGIRREQISTSEGVVYCFTLENYLATWEGFIRAYLKSALRFKVVYLQFAEIAGIKSQYGFAPYRFAIAVDSAASAGGTSSALAWNLTCSGSDRILFTFGYINEGSAADRVTSMTYNSVASTFINKILAGADYSYLYYQVAPSTGTNSVVINLNATVGIIGGAASYTGANQTGQPDANNTNSATGGSVTSLTTSVTVVAANSWLVSGSTWQQGGIGAGTSSTQRTTFGNGGSQMLDSNAAVAGGSRSLQTTGNALGGGVAGSMTMASFSPSAGAATAAIVTPTLLFMNVG